MAPSGWEDVGGVAGGAFVGAGTVGGGGMVVDSVGKSEVSGNIGVEGGMIDSGLESIAELLV